MIELNKIYKMNCIEGMKQIQTSFIDLVVTSPPYNVGKNYDIYKDTKSNLEYFNWSKEWISEVYRILKDDGRFCLNIADRINTVEIPNGIILGNICLMQGFNFYADIIWFQKDMMASTSWGSWKSASCPAFINSCEHILVFYKNTKKKIKGEDDITSKEFKKWVHTLWTFNSERKNNHPAPFPIELPYRLIKLLSFKDNIILDPFMGSGTTACAAKELHRNYIGFDISDEYIDMSQKRLEKVSKLNLGDWLNLGSD